MNTDVAERIKNSLSLEMEYPPDSTERKSRNELQGAHPLHGSSETGQNYIVHKDTQTWHCFRHHTHGDIFDMIAIDEGIISCEDAGELNGNKFIETLDIAAERAGVEMDIDEESKERIKERKEERESLKETFDAAVKYWKENLNEDVKDWIETKYGFDEETVENFDIGYAPPDSDLSSRLKEEVGELETLKSGLVMKNNSGMTDVFRGRVVFPYKKRDDFIYFIGRKTPWTDDSSNWQKGKYIKQLTPEKYDFVSDEVQNSMWGIDTLRGADEVIVTEGITDAISLADWDFPVISPVTTRFREDDIEKVKEYTRDKDVYICNDKDEGGLSGALDTLERVQRSHMIEFGDEFDEGYDLNDFYIEHSKEEFERLKDRAIDKDDALAKYKDDFIYLFKAALKENSIDPERVRKTWNTETQEHDFKGVEEILDGCYDLSEAISVFRRTEKTYWRTPTAVEKTMRKNIISGVVRRDMVKRGKLLYDSDTKRCYYFSKKNNTVFPLDGADSKGGSEAKGYLREKYGVNMTTEEGRYLLEELVNYGKSRGEEVDVKKYFWYDKQEQVLYIHNRNHHYYKLDGHNIEYKLNGEDGVFFETVNDERINYIYEEERDYPDEIQGEIDEWGGEGSFLHQVMVNRTNFASKTALTRHQQRIQFLTTLYMFPFGSTFQLKPILAFIGEKGSGKSLTMKMLGKFLISPGYDVTTMPDKNDFYVTAHNNPVYFLDNVDKGSKWLNDALAAVATGAKMKQRKLYNNYEEVEAELDTFLGLNSRDPHFKRDDVVDRLLIFYVDRLDSNIKPDLLTAPIENNWDLLWSEYMDDLNKIVLSLKKNDDMVINTEHRLVDWVDFAQKVKLALDLDGEEMEELFDGMMMEKISFSLEGDELLPAIRRLKERDFTQALNTWLSASDLYDYLCEVDELFEETYNSSLSLSKRLPNVRMELKKLVGLRKRHNRSKNRNEYMITTDDFEEDEKEDEKEDTSLNSFDGDDETLKRQILTAINEADDGEGIARDKVIEAIDDYSDDEIHEEMNNMRRDGLIYESGLDIFRTS